MRRWRVCSPSSWVLWPVREEQAEWRPALPESHKEAASHGGRACQGPGQARRASGDGWRTAGRLQGEREGNSIGALRGGCTYRCYSSEIYCVNLCSPSKIPSLFWNAYRICVCIFNVSVDRVRPSGNPVIFGLHMHHFTEYDPPWVYQ